MANAKFWKSKLLLAKPESAYATDPTLTVGANTILTMNVKLSPFEGDTKDRNVDRPYMGSTGFFVTGQRVVLSFETELAGSGAAGTAPKWGVLARGCGLAEVIVASTSVTYNPVSTSQESLYFKFWADGILHAIKGARGNGVLQISAQDPPKIAWTFTGLYVDPTDTANLVPDFTGWTAPLVATTVNTPTFSINSVTGLVLRDYKLDFGNKVTPRFLIGRDEIRISDKAEQLDMTIEAIALATLNPFALIKAQTPIAVSLVHGTAAGNIVTVAAPKAQLKPSPGMDDVDNAVEWSLGSALQPNAGNDQFTIALT